MITIEGVKEILERFVRRGMMLMLVFSPIFFSCIQELGVFKRADPAVIINGVITNEFGPHVIKIAKTKEFNTAASYFLEVEKAIVIIEDSEGNTVQLLDQASGKYFTPDSFIGVVGRAYRLKVTLISGEVYQSEFEELLPVPAIEEITFKVVQKEILTSNNNISTERLVSFFIDYTDPPNVDNYYRWRYHETFEIFAPEAEAFKEYYNPFNTGGARSYLVPNAICWAQGYDNEFLKIDRDFVYDGQEMINIEIYDVELGRKFAENYMVEIQQHSLTPEAYSYLEAIKNQIGNNGTIFETSNYQIRGNISNINDNDELVLGYFGVSAVTSKSILVRPGDIGFQFLYSCEPDPASGNIPALCLDCTTYSASSTPTKPDYWPL